jgi:Yip1-like protein
MNTFARRVLGAMVLDRRTYEEVEADAGATGQAVGVVVLASVAGGIGVLGLGAAQTPQSLVAGIVGSLIGWMAWAALTYLIGTRLLPEPQTKADFGELLRTIAFASAPGFFRVLGTIPFLGGIIYAIASMWMLLAMIVAVRQALDYQSTGRAVGVCVVGWALSLVVAAIIGIIFAPIVT